MMVTLTIFEADNVEQINSFIIAVYFTLNEYQRMFKKNQSITNHV